MVLHDLVDGGSPWKAGGRNNGNLRDDRLIPTNAEERVRRLEIHPIVGLPVEPTPDFDAARRQPDVLRPHLIEEAQTGRKTALYRHLTLVGLVGIDRFEPTIKGHAEGRAEVPDENSPHPNVVTSLPWGEEAWSAAPTARSGAHSP